MHILNIHEQEKFAEVINQDFIVMVKMSASESK